MSPHRLPGRTGRPRPSPRPEGGPPVSSAGGFALIYALLALILLGGLAAAGLLVAATDYRLSRNHQASVSTFYTTDGARNDFLAVQGVPQPSATYVQGHDSVSVTSRALAHLPDGHSVYLVTADGLDRDPAEGGAARRTSGVAVFFPFPMTVPGAFTAVNGLVKEGASGIIDGNDEAPPGACPFGLGEGASSAVAGVAVPPGGYEQHGGKQPVPTGDPPIDDSRTTPDLLDYTGIDWEGLVTESKVVPDARVPGDAWPDFASLPADEWPVIHVTADAFDLTPTHSGRGALILDGDVELQGDFEWDGIILVGGRLTTNGFQEISGTVITGLNRIFPGKNPQASEIGNGTKAFRYNSCDVEAALRGMGWLTEKPATWREII